MLCIIAKVALKGEGKVKNINCSDVCLLSVSS